jgi:hypothetical protein
MRSPRASSMLVSPIASTSDSIGPRALRTFTHGSSSWSHRVTSSSHH